MASSSAVSSVGSCPSPSSFSLLSCSYEVLLSFRRIDIRTSFIDHLYAALEQRGLIITFKDDEVLLKAIEQSGYAIVVFSEYYASSYWCLDELVYIMDELRRGQLAVFPVFYGVDPSEVRTQTGIFGRGFANLAGRNYMAKKAKVWRKALRDAANLSGCYVRNTDGFQVASWCIVEFLCQALGINYTFENWRNVLGGEGSNTSLTSFKTISTYSSTKEEHMETEYSLVSFIPRSSTDEEHRGTGYSSEGSTSLTPFKAISTGIMSDGAHMTIEYVARWFFAGQSSSKDNGQIQVSGLKRKRSCSDMPHTQPVAAVAHTTQDATQVQDTEMATIKVSYNENMIKFLLPRSASMADLIENVTTRFDVLKNKPFQIKYKDEDDEWILITCDKDLEYCMASSVTQKVIRMSVVPITNL